MLSARAVSAQRNSVSPATAAGFYQLQQHELGKSGGSAKVVDTKRTIKYLQAKNGKPCSHGPDAGVVTTWHQVYVD
jgi:hypothetical protein